MKVGRKEEGKGKTTEAGEEYIMKRRKWRRGEVRQEEDDDVYRRGGREQ